MTRDSEREKSIVRVSLVGVLVNVVLVVFKMLVGLASGSIAVIVDALNNLSDVLSSLITIAGTKLAARAPDKDHPVGHRRLEYLTTMVVAVLILYAGVTALVESSKKIIQPTPVSYDALTLLVLVLAIVLKAILGRYVREQGRVVKSGALEASGLDALYDAVISLSVLASALLYLGTGLSLEAWVGALIAIFISKSGLELIGSAVNAMVGARVSSELSQAVKATVSEVPGVLGAYDLFLNDYGPGNYYGSLNIEVAESMRADEIDRLSHLIQKRVRMQHGVELTSIGVNAYNVANREATLMREDVRELVLAHEGVIEMHGFYVNAEYRLMHFDVIISFNVRDRKTLREHIAADVQRRYPLWKVHSNFDLDISD